MKSAEEIQDLLFERLTEDQKNAVRSEHRQVLVVAGAGSGKTEVIARRIAWWVGVEGVPRDHIVAFTFTEKAAQEMKFRIRTWIQKISLPGENVTLGGMYVGTIHGFCLLKLRELWPDDFHNYEILDETGSAALIHRGFYGVLGLGGLKAALQAGDFDTIRQFQEAYDILQEYNLFNVQLPAGDPPIALGAAERDWCEQAVLLTDVGNTERARAFALSAARYYAYLKCRRFLDFSTSQSEFVRRLTADHAAITKIRETISHLVVDELQDVNGVQFDLIQNIIGDTGKLTAVGDHRQAIYQFRGGRVDIIGDMWQDINNAADGEVIDLQDNFRSTARIINLANQWAGTIGQVGNMATPAMTHGNAERVDFDQSHVGSKRFATRQEEAAWIAATINQMVVDDHGARHNQWHNEDRGISLSDIAILLRSSTDARLYMQTLEANNIPAIFRAGPDLFSQPEVLLIISAYAVAAGIQVFFGSGWNPKSLPARIRNTLNCNPIPEEVLRASCIALRNAGLHLDDDLEDRLLRAVTYMHQRMADGISFGAGEVASFHSTDLKNFLRSRNELRRVFHQKIYHMLLEEIGVNNWDTDDGRGTTALFHLGAFSKMLTSIETPGWTSVRDFHYQVIALLQHGSESGKTDEAPLLVPPDAVTITTIHSAKGLEFPVVFLADVCSRRFPSVLAGRQVQFPFSGQILTQIDVAQLSDNRNNDSERRLMYVAVTRAERYLFITASGDSQSQFYRTISGMVNNVGGVVRSSLEEYPVEIELIQTSYSRELRLSTSFSDFRYYLECPHDFYLRKVLGFAPTIDQAFGYGKGVHNLLRAVHTDPTRWVELAGREGALEGEIQRLIDRGLFYLRYTTGDPADNLRNAGLRSVAQYVRRYIDELSRMRFEPEKEFETLLEEEQVLISGAIDVIRLDDPPRVTLVDFKSGDADNANASGLDDDQMRLQIAIYGHAAQHELEYEPEQGLIRYLGEDDDARAERQINLNEESIAEARQTALETAHSIKSRDFHRGPSARNPHRCRSCDFKGFCGLQPA